ncbi:MAG: zinc finger protein [Verrucomicrobiota bacterium]|jgi:hypothetical protein
MIAATRSRKNPGAGKAAGANFRTANRHRYSDTIERQAKNRQELDTAKARVGISVAWLALCLPGEPRRSCCSPFRDDRHPSFSISPDDRLWHDHATGEGGDVVSFIIAATSCDHAAAIARLKALAGGAISTPLPLRRIAPKAKESPPAPKPLPALDTPTFSEVRALAALRDWHLYAAFEIATARGLLRMATMRDAGEIARAWVLTDDARKTAQARRLDGNPWQRTGAKSDTLRADPAHPIGLAAIGNRPVIALCEGEPDTLAALHFAFLAGIHESVAPICLTGAAKRIPDAVAEQLRGCHVRIFRQADTAGHSAALSWAEGLESAGVEVCGVNLDGLTRPDGTPAKDLADLARWPVESWTEPEAEALDAAQHGSEGRTLGPVAPGWFDLWKGVKP